MKVFASTTTQVLLAVDYFTAMRGTKMDFCIKKTAAIAGIFLCWQTCQAGNFETYEHIEDITKNFLIKTIEMDPEDTAEINVIKANFPQQLPVCTTEIGADIPKNSSKEQIASIELTCNGAQPWHALIPVEVKIFTKVIVAKQTLQAKNTLTENDIDYAQYDKNHLYTGYFKNKEEVIGQISNRFIQAGTVLSSKNLQAPMLIHRNQVIKIVARSNSVVVEMNGIAKSDGSENSLIKVYNPSSKRILDAVVIDATRAEIVS